MNTPEPPKWLDAILDRLTKPDADINALDEAAAASFKRGSRVRLTTY